MVCILLGHGFEETEAVVPIDVLRRAGVEVKLVSLAGEEVTSSHGITVRADLPLDRLNREQVELLFLPGGMGGVSAIQNCAPALDLIRELAADGKWVTAICAAPTILGKLGLLHGRKAVCYPGMEEGLVGAQVSYGAPFVLDGNFLTGEAAGSAFPFGLKMVELLKGREAAEKVKLAVHYHGDF